MSPQRDSLAAQTASGTTLTRSAPAGLFCRGRLAIQLRRVEMKIDHQRQVIAGARANWLWTTRACRTMIFPRQKALSKEPNAR